MGIIKMQRIGVLLMRKDSAALLRLAQRCGCVHVIQAQQPQELTSGTLQEEKTKIQEKLDSIRWALAKLARYDTEKRSLISPLPEVEREALEQSEYPQAMWAVSEAERLEHAAGELRGRETRLRLLIEQLMPWLALDIPVEDLVPTRSTRIYTGYAKLTGLNRLKDEWKERPAMIYTLGAQRDLQYFVAWVHGSLAEDFQAELRSIGFQQASPGEGKGTPPQQKELLLQQLEHVMEQNGGIEKELEALGAYLPQMRLAYEAFSADKSRLETGEFMVNTQSATLMEGWIPAHLAESFENEVKAAFPYAQLAFRDAQEGEEPPVLLGNRPLVAPYEAVVTGFALPDPAGIDPTSLMMPFFACFFGMMVSDAGYGLVMAILIPILIRIMKPAEGLKKIMWILAGGGIATVFWGALYNTWFGFAPFTGVFDPVNNSMPVMALCVGIGAVHLFAGLIMGAYVNVRDKKPLDAVYDQVSWMLLVIGLGMLFLPQTAGAGQWMAIAGAVIILLTAGREKSKNPVKRIISGLGALYGVTSWISDLLSYMRLFGMGLATGVIGMVINQLVGMMTAGGSILGYVIGAVVFVGAHLFNAAINILGAYVHACRLQYIEFFGKFYQEGGEPFQPLRFSPRHVRVKDAS